MIGARSKALMRALEIQARCALDGAYRVSAGDADIDPELRDWIESAAPQAARTP